MNDHKLDKASWHFREFLEWARSVGELFPALWDAAKVFAPLVLDYCPVCHRPLTILWIPVGDHDVCDRLEGGETVGGDADASF